MLRGHEWLIGQQMNKELIRLSSFRSYPNREVFPIKLAKAGFVYEENGDEVKCFECGITYKHWRKGDDPIEIHVRLSPKCRFLTREVNVRRHIEQQLPLRTDGRQLTEKTAAKLGYWKDGSMKDPDVNLIAPVFNSSQQKVNVSCNKKEIAVRLSSNYRNEAANDPIKEGTTSQICTNEERLGEFTLVLKLSWKK